MSGECVQITPTATTTTHGAVVDKLKRRVGNLQQRQQICHQRQALAQPHLNDQERIETQKLLQQVNENKLRKAGRHKMALDRQGRMKLGDSLTDGREDFGSSNGPNLKRKLEGNGGFSGRQGIMLQSPAYNGYTSTSPASAAMPSQYDFNDASVDRSKKMKFDSVSDIQPNLPSPYNAIDAANSNNCNSAEQSLFSDISRSLSDPMGSLMQTSTFNPANNMSQDGVPSFSNALPSNSVAQDLLLNGTQQGTGSPPKGNTTLDQGLMGTSQIDDTDLEALLNDIGFPSPDEFNDIGKPNNDGLQPLSNEAQVATNVSSQATGNNDGIHDSSPLQLLNSNDVQQQQQQQQQQQRFGSTQSESNILNAAQQQRVVFNNGANRQPSVSGNGPLTKQTSYGGNSSNLTSQHLQKLSHSLDCSPVEKQVMMQQQHQQQQQQQQQQQMTITRIRTPSSVDNVRHTPNNVVMFPPSPVPVPNVMSPPSGSILMQGQGQLPPSGPTPSGKSPHTFAPQAHGNQSVSSSNTILADAHNYPANSFGVQTKQLPNYPSNNQPSPSARLIQRVPSYGSNISSAPSQYQGRQPMKVLPGRTANAINQWNPSDNATFNETVIQRQLHQRVGVNQIAAQRPSGSNMAVSDLPPQYKYPNGNIPAASAAAQRVLAASQQQHSNAYGGRMAHYRMQLNQQRDPGQKTASHGMYNPMQPQARASAPVYSMQMKRPMQHVMTNGSGFIDSQVSATSTGGIHGNQLADGRLSYVYPSSTQSSSGVTSFAQQQKQLELYQRKVDAHNMTSFSTAETFQSGLSPHGVPSYGHQQMSGPMMLSSDPTVHRGQPMNGMGAAVPLHHSNNSLPRNSSWSGRSPQLEGNSMAPSSNFHYDHLAAQSLNSSAAHGISAQGMNVKSRNLTAFQTSPNSIPAPLSTFQGSGVPSNGSVQTKRLLSHSPSGFQSNQGVPGFAMLTHQHVNDNGYAQQNVFSNAPLYR